MKSLDAVLRQRRRLGAEKLADCWAGDWRVRDPPRLWHVHLEASLRPLLATAASRLGLSWPYEAIGVFAGPSDWRIPSLAIARPEVVDQPATSAVLGVTFETVDGPRLRITGPDVDAEV